MYANVFTYMLQQPPELETMSAPQPATQQLPVEIQEEEITIHILREPRQGLGISIAGGQGSTPVKGDDEVSVCLWEHVSKLMTLRIHTRRYYDKKVCGEL